jgi:hypothetical protein
MADFASRYISEVESGKGLFGGAKSALEGTSKDVGKKFSKENLVRSTFGGDDIFSALIRSKLGVKKKPEKEKEKEKTPTKEGAPEGGEFPTEGISFLKIIAKNTMSLPWMARDMNVLRQNLQKLVKIKAGPQKKGVKAYATGADAYFLREDEREAALEAQRAKIEGGPKPAKVGGEEKEGEGGGLIGTIVSFFSGGFMKAIKFIFNPRSLAKIFSKVFLPIAIIGTLFNGIMDGFKRYQETGSFSDAIVAGLGGMLEFITFGLFGEDTLKTLFESISNFFAPITETISNVFNNIKNFIKGLFGGTVDVEDKAPQQAEKVAPTMPDTKQFVQNAGKASGMSDEKSKDLGGVFGAVQSGNIEGVIGKAQEFAKKYPEPPSSETSPTVAAAAAVATPTSVNEVPAPAPTTTPAPSPSPVLSTDDQIKQIEGYIDANNRRLVNREDQDKRRIESFKKRYANDPERVAEFVKDIQEGGKEYRNEIEAANTQHRENITNLKKQKTVTSSPVSASSPPAGAISGASDDSPSESGGASTDSGATASAGGVTPIAGGASPSAETNSGAPSGGEISTASSAVAEGQRMESAADMGSIINAPTTNSSTASQGKPPNTIADAYDTEFAKLLATTA